MGGNFADVVYGKPPLPPSPPVPVPARLISSPGMIVPGNIDLNTRPVVKNPDGSISTVRSMSFGTDDGEVLVPTVSNGADGQPPHIMSDDEAMRYYRKTGQNLGTFDTADHATDYAQRMHQQQAQQYKPARSRR